jgi:putative tryptophan/tyrosine transport system substrate-binding protein
MTMQRREFITLLGGASAWPLATRAQQALTPVIGVLSPTSPAAAVRNIAALRQGLRELGYIDGRNIAIEYRFAEGVTERLDKLVAELVALKPALIVVGSTLGIVAAHAVTTTVPLITIGLSGDDPVRLGLAQSFARPGGNLTGFLLSANAGLVGKRLSLLRGAVPRISRLGVIANPDSPGDAAELTVLPSIAAQLGLHYRVFEVRTPEQLDAAFAAIVQDSFHALYVSWTPVLNTHRARVIALAGQARLPAVYGFREFVRAGGLMSYGPDLPDLYRRAASYIDKILKGEKPGDLPLQAADKYELLINLNTAKALGLAISESFLLLADEVIE